MLSLQQNQSMDMQSSKTQCLSKLWYIRRVATGRASGIKMMQVQALVNQMIQHPGALSAWMPLLASFALKKPTYGRFPTIIGRAWHHSKPSLLLGAGAWLCCSVCAASSHLGLIDSMASGHLLSVPTTYFLLPAHPGGPDPFITNGGR